MAGSVVQSVYAVDDSGSSATTIAATLTGVTAGNLIDAFVGWGDTYETSTVSVSDGTAYTADATGKVVDSGNDQASQNFYLPNAGSGSHTVTATISASLPYRRIRVAEFAGLQTSSVEDQATGQYNASTNAPSSGATAATTNANDFVVGWVQDTGHVDPGTGTLSAGSGYTLSGSNQILGLESKSVSSTGAQTATFSDTKSSTRTTHVIAFKEAAGGGGSSTAVADHITASRRNRPGRGPYSLGRYFRPLGETGAPAAASAVDGTAGGAVLAATSSLAVAGAASGDAAAAGATLTTTASLLAGTATGAAVATGATPTATASLVAGTAASGATASAATLTATSSLVAGGASGAADAAAATLTATSSLIAGAASGSGSATAAGVTLTATASLATAGAAAGDASAAAASLAATASLIAGSASGAGSSTASGVTLAATASLASTGAASGDAAAPGATLTAQVSLAAVGQASGSATASGAQVVAAASIIVGAASGVRNATATGMQVIAAASIIVGAAIGDAIVANLQPGSRRAAVSAPRAAIVRAQPMFTVSVSEADAA